MNIEPVDPRSFVAAVKPLLEGHDLNGLCTLLRSRWSPNQITDLLSSKVCDARKVAALALSLVGGRCCIKELARQLRDPDPMVNQMAEHALWAIWFRLGSPEANCQMKKGMESLNARDFQSACKHFSKAIEIDPDFAEAYNQRAIVYYLREAWDKSITDCLRTIDLMPEHFGALAGLGHCYAHLNQTTDAITAYERALTINPHMTCVKQTLEELRNGV